MRHFIPQMSPQRHQQILDESRTAGRMGSPRLPASAHHEDISDSMLVRALDAHAEGFAEHAQEHAA